jgi:hypothetical protein
VLTFRAGKLMQACLIARGFQQSVAAGIIQATAVAPTLIFTEMGQPVWGESKKQGPSNRADESA